MKKSSKIIFSIFIALIITFFCNCKYFFIGTLHQLASYHTEHLSKKYTLFKFTSYYLDKDYSGIILWDKFFIILIISYLIARGLREDFIENFPLRKSESYKKEDIVFVYLFLLLLLIPMLRFDNRKYDPYENRNLDKLPHLFTVQRINTDKEEQKINNLKITNNESNNKEFELKEKPKIVKLNFSYFKQLEGFINDRFFARTFLIQFYKNFRYDIAFRYPYLMNYRVIDKKTKWLTNAEFPAIYQKRKSKKSYISFVNQINQSLKSFKQYCDNHGIELYILVLPEKESIYRSSVVKKQDNSKYLQDYINDVNKDNELSIIFPYNELQKAAKNSKNLLYYKVEHHLTDDGMYVAYKALMEQIKKRHPEIKIVQKDAYNESSNFYIRQDNNRYSYGYTCHVVGLTTQQCRQHSDYLYRYLEHKKRPYLKSKLIREPSLLMEKFNYPFGSDYKVLLIGNSYIEGLSNFTSYTFKDIYKIRLNGPSGIKVKDQYKVLKNYENIIKSYKPNIIILCIGYAVLKNFSDLTNFE